MQQRSAQPRSKTERGREGSLRPPEPSPIAEPSTWNLRSIVSLVSSAVGQGSKPKAQLPPESNDEVVARLLELEHTVHSGHEQVAAKLQKLDADIRTATSDVQHELEGVKRNMNKLEDHVNAVTHPDHLAKILRSTLRSTVESVLPDYLMVRMDSNTGKFDFDPQVWKYLKSLFVSKEQVAEATKTIKSTVDEVRSEVEKEKSERLREEKKFVSKEQMEAELRSKMDGMKRNVDTAIDGERSDRQKDAKTFVHNGQVETIVRAQVDEVRKEIVSERSERQRDERNFMNKEQVDAVVKDQVNTLRREMEKERQKDLKHAMDMAGSIAVATTATATATPKIAQPLWDEFIQDNREAVDEFVRRHVEPSVGKMVDSGVIVSKLQFMDILNYELNQLRADMVNIKDEALDAVVVQQRQQEQRRRGAFVDINLTDDSAIAINKLIDLALKRYSQDVLARPDYALLTSGARVIPTLTTRNYKRYPRSIPGFWSAKITGFGLVHGQPPQVALSEGTNVGNCWCFNGAEGMLGIQLSQSVIVTDITIEHVGHNIAHDDRKSAPREIEVWGEDWRTVSSAGDDKNEPKQDRKPFLITSFSYDFKDEDMIQTFQVAHKHFRPDRTVRSLVVKVKSNWGHPYYTCLYRVRVHGRPENS